MALKIQAEMIQSCVPLKCIQSSFSQERERAEAAASAAAEAAAAEAARAAAAVARAVVTARRAQEPMRIITCIGHGK